MPASSLVNVSSLVPAHTIYVHMYVRMYIRTYMVCLLGRGSPHQWGIGAERAWRVRLLSESSSFTLDGGREHTTSSAEKAMTRQT